MPIDDPRAFLATLYRSAVARAQPHAVLPPHLPSPPANGRTIVLGAGKAAAAMAQAVEALWPAGAPLSGLVVTRYGHVPPRAAGLAQRIAVREAAHPVPDAAGAAAAAELLALAASARPDDLVLCLLSGGGSSLLALPQAGLSLADLQAVTRGLLASGAAIGEMNCVRKHLSRIQGGWLAVACAPAPLVALAISDVPGDDPAVIASGPTVADASTCADALDVLRRHGIDLPDAARHALEAGDWETPKPGDPRLAGARTTVIAAPRQSLQAAADAARAAGIAAHVLSDAIEGESRDVGRVHAALARAVAAHGQPFARPCVLLSGGETTVTVRHPQPGTGGRAGEFALGLAAALEGATGIWALAADTDGIDGAGEAAGAFVTPDTLARAAAAGHPVAAALASHGSHGCFGAIDDLLVTGPTHTNVNDFRALLIL